MRGNIVKAVRIAGVMVGRKHVFFDGTFFRVGACCEGIDPSAFYRRMPKGDGRRCRKAVRAMGHHQAAAAPRR